MKSALVCLALVLLLAWATANQTAAQTFGKKSVHAFPAAKKGDKRTTTFSTDVPVIYVFWKGEGLIVGDTIGAIWIAEQVGEASSKESEIRRGELKIYKPTDEQGAFFLSRPSGRIWPVGKYRVELYINGAIAEVVKFTIAPGVTIQVH